jgi:uncharacterized protein (DUF433 family)
MIDVKTSTIVRTERGLTVAGTRITLYDVLDYLKQDWSPKLVRDWFNFSEEQMTDILSYIETHREEVETEYEKVLARAEKNREYWEKIKQEKIKNLKENPANRKLYEKLKARKDELGVE